MFLVFRKRHWAINIMAILRLSELEHSSLWTDDFGHIHLTSNLQFVQRLKILFPFIYCLQSWFFVRECPKTSLFGDTTRSQLLRSFWFKQSLLKIDFWPTYSESISKKFFLHWTRDRPRKNHELESVPYRKLKL